MLIAHYLVVRDFETRQEVHRIDVSSKSERMRERTMMGMLQNMDTDRFFVEEEDTIIASPIGWTPPEET